MNENRTSILAIVLSMLAGMGLMHLYENDKTEFAEKYSMIEECEKVLEENNIPKPDNVEREGVINGYLSAYDEYTYYTNKDYDSAENVEWFVNTMPTAYGCGFAVKYNDRDELIFDKLDSDLYAFQQGIREGDKIVSIDGEVFEGDYNFAKKLLGKDGTTCKLVIERGGKQTAIDLIRHSAKKDWGISYEMLGDTLKIKISRFGFGVASFIKRDMAEYGYKSVILDLRDNPGGIIGEAVSVADIFIGDGYVTEHAYKGTTYDYKTTADEDDIDVPVVVLVNENSASSAEILTALMKQYGGATIVGEKTFGKGIYQTEEYLSDGGILHYTQGYYTVGDWKCYHGEGIYPDVEVEMRSVYIGTDDDTQLQKAIEILN
ncbi:MAG: hypothetical protein K2J08_06970 [Ruminococcus sp.]|nr:hypothetical protein [Ruminococcus sp.]